jgi:DNA helicase-2/ATP-dependent DNA helicase PcrA
LAYLRVIFNPADDISLLRIINVPRRGIGDTTIAKLVTYASSQEINLFDVVSNPELVPGLSARTKGLLESLATIIFNLLAQVGVLPVVNLVQKVMDDSGYVAELEKSDNPQDETRLENLHELLSVAKEFAASEMEDTLESFLTRVSLVSDIDNADLTKQKVTLMTLHSAKGLEFPIVFLSGMEEGIFPHARTLMNENEVEEERRICYVGITRARRKLYLSNARMRTIYGRTTMFPPSRFLEEIPSHMLEKFSGRQQTAYVASTTGRSGGAADKLQTMPLKTTPATPMPHQQVIKPQAGVAWQAGDKAQHGKWGIGTVVDIRGTGENQEVRIAFPGQGIKQLMVKFAPISKV